MVSSLFLNSCWILGLALLLASFSYHYQQAITRETSLMEQLRHKSFVGVAWISLVLVGVGAVGTSQDTWEAVLWILLTAYALWQAVTVWLSRTQVVKE